MKEFEKKWCTCAEDYTKRNIDDPDCAWHRIGEDIVEEVRKESQEMIEAWVKDYQLACADRDKAYALHASLIGQFHKMKEALERIATENLPGCDAEYLAQEALKEDESK